MRSSHIVYFYYISNLEGYDTSGMLDMNWCLWAVGKSYLSYYNIEEGAMLVVI